MNKCAGCGVELQNISDKELGYTINLDNSLCERCFRIKNYNDYKVVTKSNEDYIKILREINKTDSLVILLVDLFDIPKALEDINKYINNKILLVLTKRDILPVSVYDENIINYFKRYKLNIVDTLITESGVQFAMPGSMKIMLANAPTFVGLSEQLFTQYVTDSIVYEPMISPATSSLCIVKVSDEANVSDLKQEVIDNANPRKWICTGAEKCLAIDSGNYILLIMSTPDNCEAMKNAFTKHFGADNVGEALTKDGVPAQDFGDDFGGGMLLE